MLVFLVYYHRLKSRSLLANLKRFEECLRRRTRDPAKASQVCKYLYYQTYHNLAKCYVRFMAEVKCYQRHYWSMYLSQLFIFLQTLITYLLYLSFAPNIPAYLTVGNFLGTLLITLNLGGVVYACRFIHLINLSAAGCFFNLNFHFQRLRWYHPHRYLKLEATCINIRNSRNGFHFYDGKLINSRTFLNVLINISAFFVLILKNQVD